MSSWCLWSYKSSFIVWLGTKFTHLQTRKHHRNISVLIWTPLHFYAQVNLPLYSSINLACLEVCQTILRRNPLLYNWPRRKDLWLFQRGCSHPAPGPKSSRWTRKRSKSSLLLALLSAMIRQWLIGLRPRYNSCQRPCASGHPFGWQIKWLHLSVRLDRNLVWFCISYLLKFPRNCPLGT